MSNYFSALSYSNEDYALEALNFKEFESCVFTACDFSKCNFIALSFIDCTFINCIFNETKINHVAFRTAYFNGCKIKDVNFAMCDKFIFEIHFKDCTLDFSKFYALKMKRTSFTNCSLVAVDFMSADLSEVVFDSCDLYKSEFEKAILIKTDFKTSYNYSIDPTKSKLKKTLFSLENVKGLLFKHDIIVY